MGALDAVEGVGAAATGCVLVRIPLVGGGRFVDPGFEECSEGGEGAGYDADATLDYGPENNVADVV